MLYARPVDPYRKPPYPERDSVEPFVVDASARTPSEALDEPTSRFDRTMGIVAVLAVALTAMVLAPMRG
jgi:hypothetical protein